MARVSAVEGTPSWNLLSCIILKSESGKETIFKITEEKRRRLQLDITVPIMLYLQTVSLTQELFSHKIFKLSENMQKAAH